MAGEDQVLFQVIVAGTFVKGARRDDFVAFDADVLLEEEVAIESVKRYCWASAE